MVELYSVASSWGNAAWMCFFLAWMTAIWIAGGLNTEISGKTRSIVRAGLIGLCLFVIALEIGSMQYVVMQSTGLEMMQQSRASFHEPPIPASQLMKLGVGLFWPSWLVIALALICSAFMAADNWWSIKYPRTLTLIYAAFFTTLISGAGLVGASVWINLQSPILIRSAAVRSSQFVIDGLTAFSGITILAYFIVIYRQRKAA
jgi:hypothetical protein